MSGNFNYAALPKDLLQGFRFLLYLLTQINFWIFANLLLGVIIHLHSLAINETLHLKAASRFAPMLGVLVIWEFYMV